MKYYDIIIDTLNMWILWVFILCCLPIVLIGCTKDEDKRDEYEVGKCYQWGDEAQKLVAISDYRYYYKHSWNAQDKIFESRYFHGREISCGKDGYEFEILAFKLNRAESDIKYLKELTEPLRQRRK